MPERPTNDSLGDRDGARVEVSRRIDAPPARIFEVLADPNRQKEFDGSDMLRGSLDSPRISKVGDVFTMRMHRMGRDYLMINHVVEFEQGRRIVWQPAPGDLDTAGGDPARIGVPAGYSWGFALVPDGDGATLVTETFDCGPEGNRFILEDQDGRWINGSNTVAESMAATLERLDEVVTRGGA